MKAFEGFKSEASGNSYPMLPVGAYVCEIKNVKIDGKEPDGSKTFTSSIS